MLVVHKNTLSPELTAFIEEKVGGTLLSSSSIGYSTLGTYYRLVFSGGLLLSAKVARKSPPASLEMEAFMIAFLGKKSRLPVPDVIYSDPNVILMRSLLETNATTCNEERLIARHVAELHKETAPYYGLDFNTSVRGVPLPNGKSKSWRDFFIEHRLVYMVKKAFPDDVTLRTRVENLAAKLHQYLDDPPRPALVHGNLHRGSVFCDQEASCFFTNPGIYYADPEIDLALTLGKKRFSENFLRYYDEFSPLRPGFYEVRLPVYQLYAMMLQHATEPSLELEVLVGRILARFGV